MKKLLNLLFCISLLPGILPLTSCHCKKKTSAATAAPELKNNLPAGQTDFETQGYIKATVINYTVDGCSFLLQLADQRKLEPVNLTAEFKKDNLAVWIKYIPKKGGASVCMTGQLVELSDIQIRR